MSQLPVPMSLLKMICNYSNAREKLCNSKMFAYFAHLVSSIVTQTSAHIFVADAETKLNEFLAEDTEQFKGNKRN